MIRVADRGAGDAGAPVTVVIPTHDRRDLLLRTLDSVLRQRDVVVEVVVVDDGSSDGTAEAVRGLGLPQVRLVRHARAAGVSAARNAGLAQVRTPWVAFTDDDDLWAPDKLRSQLAALDRVPGAGWSCVGAVHVDGDVQVTSYSPVPPAGDVPKLLLKRNWVPGGGSGVVVGTALAREVGGFDEDISILADWDFYLRLGLRRPIATVDEPLLAYYVHADSMYHDPTGVVRELGHLRLKYRDLPSDDVFEPDLAQWYARLAGLADRLGDRRTAVWLTAAGVVEAGALRMGRELFQRLGRKLRLLAGPDVPGVEAAQVEWLDRYQEWHDEAVRPTWSRPA